MPCKSRSTQTLHPQADREKADAAAAAQRAHREAEAAAQRAAAQAAAEQAQQEAEAADAAARFQADLEAKRARLLPEPPAGEPGAVDVMVRLPGGGRASRRCAGPSAWYCGGRVAGFRIVILWACALGRSRKMALAEAASERG